LEAFDEQFWTALYSRDYAGALKFISTAAPNLVEGDFGGKSPNSGAEAEVYLALGDQLRAEQALLTLRRDLDAKANPENRNEFYYNLAAKYDAGLGRKEDALRTSQKAVQLIPSWRDAIEGPFYASMQAQVQAWVGNKDAAIEQLSALLKRAAGPSYGELKLDPSWDDLRGDPRFEGLIARASRPVSLE
jgi:tetratricopeptide (TPR) repeat protein